jgi:hypothetical protein
MGMALEGPQVRYSRVEGTDAERRDDGVARALRLAREVEALLEEAPSVAAGSEQATHATRMARAMAASLVDELEALVRGSRQSGNGRSVA